MDDSKSETDLNNLFHTWSGAGPCHSAHVTFTVPNTSYALTKEYRIAASNWTLDASLVPGVSISQGASSGQRLFNLLASQFTAAGLIFKGGAVIGPRGGGCLYSVASSVILQDCYFHDWRVVPPPFDGSIYSISGGTLFSNGGSFSATNCRFINSTSSNQGGAIYLNSMRVATFVQCSFQGCSAENGGAGAVSFATEGGPSKWTANIVSSVFSNNTCRSAGKGGAILVESSSIVLTVTGSNFTNNVAGSDRNDIVLNPNVLDTGLICTDTCAITNVRGACLTTCPGK